jgi:DNA-binding winged helix-turn-helix (wHTH) protein/tetratricopeptide (TPR) repeat protein
VLDPRSGELRCGSSRTILQEQPLKILLRLLARPGELVTREELRHELWPDDTFVDFEHSLNAAVKRLRAALGDDADAPRFIETVPRRGYRLIARTTGVSAAALALAALTVGVAVLASWAAIQRPVSDSGAHIVPSAYDEYMQGVRYRRQWQAGGCPEAVTHLRRAVAIDPSIADAYVQLAFCYAAPDRMHVPGAEAAPVARAALARALALDARSALAHSTLAYVKLVYDYDWDGARAECAVAMTLAPDGQADINCGELAYLTGHVDEGLARIREGVRRDPLNLDQQVAYGFALRNVGQFDEAIAQFRRILQYDAQWPSARFWLAYTLADRNRPDEAIPEYLEFLRLVVLEDRVDEVTSSLGVARRAGGADRFWRDELRLADDHIENRRAVWRQSNAFYSGPYSMARRCARVGDTRNAIAWLRRAYDYRHHLMVFVDREPLFVRFRETPSSQSYARVSACRADDIVAGPRTRPTPCRVGRV